MNLFNAHPDFENYKMLQPANIDINISNGIRYIESYERGQMSYMNFDKGDYCWKIAEDVDFVFYCYRQRYQKYIFRKKKRSPYTIAFFGKLYSEDCAIFGGYLFQAYERREKFIATRVMTGDIIEFDWYSKRRRMAGDVVVSQDCFLGMSVQGESLVIRMKRYKGYPGLNVHLPQNDPYDYTVEFSIVVTKDNNENFHATRYIKPLTESNATSQEEEPTTNVNRPHATQTKNYSLTNNNVEGNNPIRTSDGNRDTVSLL